ncbi:hypothetical protein GBA52_028629 [Prunus armeniaca]|nr:hypothetical protein GBA52_028629 [Prunus armeniaca]
MLDKEYKVFLEGLDLHGGDDGQDYHDTRWIVDGDVHSNAQLMDHGDVNLNGRSVDSDDFDDDVDPQYKILLENLKEDGKSYVLVVVRENENLERIKGILEESEGLPNKNSLGVKKNVKVEAMDPVSDRTKGRSNKIHGVEVPTTQETLKSSHLKKKKVNKKGADSRTKGHPVKRPHLASMDTTMELCLIK